MCLERFLDSSTLVFHKEHILSASMQRKSASPWTYACYYFIVYTIYVSKHVHYVHTL